MTGDGVNDAVALKKADCGIAVNGSTEAAIAAADIKLGDDGLSTIITAIETARMIFQRMRNYCIYRVACTIQLLMFFFIAIMCFQPKTYPYDHGEITEVAEFFCLPVMAIVIITILNDGCILSIAYDNVEPSNEPERW